jgi:hypothetical protein
MDDRAEKLRVLWKKARNMYASFFTELDAVRHEIGDDKLADWCFEELHMSLSIISSTASLLRKVDADRVRSDLADAQAGLKEAQVREKRQKRIEREQAEIASATAAVEKAKLLAEKARFNAEAEKAVNRSKANEMRRREYAADPDKRVANAKRCREYDRIQKAKRALVAHPDLNDSQEALSLTTEAIRGRDLVAKGEHDWIEGSVILAATMASARKFFAANSDFGHWLSAAKLDRFNAADRAGLINLGRLSNLREILSETNSRSYELIWRSQSSFDKSKDGNITALFPQHADTA